MTPYPGAISVTPGTMTPGFATSTRIDLNQIGEARNSMLGIKLDQVSCLNSYTRTHTQKINRLFTLLGF